jgi:hypothetical protein
MSSGNIAEVLERSGASHESQPKDVSLGTATSSIFSGKFIAEDTGRAVFPSRGGQDIHWPPVLQAPEGEDIEPLIWTPFDFQSYSEAKWA